MSPVDLTTSTWNLWFKTIRLGLSTLEISLAIFNLGLWFGMLRWGTLAWDFSLGSSGRAFRLGTSFRAFSLGTFAWEILARELPPWDFHEMPLTDVHLKLCTLELWFTTNAWEFRPNSFRLGSSACDRSKGMCRFRLETLDCEISLGDFRLGTVA